MAEAKKYVCLDKDCEDHFTGVEGRRHLALWSLAQRVRDTFKDEAATIEQVYRKVTGPLGLSKSETSKIVQSAKQAGYLDVE